MKPRQAYTLIMRLIKKGELSKPASLRCFDCGKPAREYHHFRGYEFPLHVLPLCRSCHFKREPRYNKRKLSPGEVTAIRSSSMRNYMLAKIYKVDASAISFVRSRKTYREIP